MAKPDKMQQLFKATKAELVSFAASGLLAIAGVGLAQSAPWLQQAAQTHHSLVAISLGAKAIGDVLQTIGIPAATGTFIPLVTKFGKAWRDMTAKHSSSKRGHKSGPRPGASGMSNCLACGPA